MKKNNVKNNLDEMQEQKLLGIEHNGCWMAFWGLFISIIVQSIVFNNQGTYMLGEWIIFMCLSIYLGVACIKNGIWDRRLKADAGTNLVISIISGAVVAIIMFIQVYGRSKMLVGSVCTGIFAGGFCFGLCYFVLALGAKLYRRRVEKMETEETEETEE